MIIAAVEQQQRQQKLIHIKEKIEKVLFSLFLYRKTVRSTHPHSNLTRIILGNVSVADAVEVMYVFFNFKYL